MVCAVGEEHVDLLRLQPIEFQQYYPKTIESNGSAGGRSFALVGSSY